MPDQPDNPSSSERQGSAELLEAGRQLHLDGKLEQARAKYQTVLEMEPQNPLPYNLLGVLALQVTQYDTARDLFQMAIDRDETQADFHANLAAAYDGLEEHEAAIAAYRRSLALNPDNCDSHYHLGLALKRSGSPEHAIPHLEKAITLGIRHAEVFAELAQMLVGVGRFDEAVTMARAAVKLDPDNLQGLRALTRASFWLGQYQNAYDAGRKLITRSAGNVEDHLLLARIFADSGQPNAALELAEKTLALDPHSEEATQILAAAHNMLGHWDEAMRIIDRALERRPGDSMFTLMKASILERKGKHERAYELIKPLVKENKNIKVGAIWLFAKLAKRFGEQAMAQELLENLLSRDSIPFYTRPESLYLLGSIYDDRDSFDKAFSAFREANSLRPRYSADQAHQVFIDRIIECFNSGLLQQVPRATHGSGRPVFIVGMPRSGTSLTEKILSRHPDVSAGGELPYIQSIALQQFPKILGTELPYPEYMDKMSEEGLNQAADFYLKQIEGLAPNQERHVTDKMPMNFNYLGLMALLFPEARIIHCTRNPMAIGLSCFMANFQNTDEMGFSQDLETIGRYYKRYEKLMRHWRGIFPGAIYDLSYEALVSEPETEIRKLLEFCDLPWDEGCLEPHKSEDAINTASYNQVRRPINTRSIDRWKQYEKHLKPLKNILESGD